MYAYEIKEALDELADLLTARDVHCPIRIVGGAAMVLRFGARTSTADVDVDFRTQHVVDPSSGDVDAEFRGREVVEAVQEVARRRGLEEGWLNDKAIMFFPDCSDPEWELLWERGTVIVYTASARTLLAMKLRAGRPLKDGADITFLVSELSITRYEAAVAIFDEFYPQEVLSPKAKILLRTAIEAVGQRSVPD